MKRKYDTRYTIHDTRADTGSALILVVVLTSLLAIVGVTFIMAARVNRTATSGISDSKDLDSAVDTVIAKISQELTLDVPGMPKGAEYYDYPDAYNTWLACLEPYKDFNNNYFWRRISDIYGGMDADDLWAEEIIPDYQLPSDVDEDEPADADGDGVADSKWVEIEGMTSGKGKPIYAAVRVIDNGAMLNVNTAYKFDSGETDPNLIDGSSQTQINLAALSIRGDNNTPDIAADELQYWRCGYGNEPSGENDIPDYEREVIWRYDEPNGFYTPFDIADELEVRNRFTLNREDVDSRLENVWDGAFQSGPNSHPYLSTPVTTDSNYIAWTEEVFYDDSAGPNDPDYSYRHIGTVYNMDRIINPYSGKMLNINDANKDSIYSVVSWVLNDSNFADANNVAAQIAVNMKDFRDNDSNVTVLHDDMTGQKYYGFERPCVYISELAHAVKDVNCPSGGPIGEPPPTPVYRFAYAVELYKPYSQDADPCNWRLVIGPAAGGPMMGGSAGGTPYAINWSGDRQFYVMRNDPCSLLPPIDPNAAVDDYSFTLQENGTVELQRRVGDTWIVVDSKAVPDGLIPILAPCIDEYYTSQRDITLHKCIRRLWNPNVTQAEDLGSANSYADPNLLKIQAHPPNTRFTNIGELGMVFRKSAYSQDSNSIDKNDTETDVRLNLENSSFQKLFNYLTVFDPTADNIDNDNDGLTDIDALNQTPEWKIPGRININTAPWFVLKQLPWMRTNIARAIVAYRDMDSISSGPDYSGRSGEPGFRNIAELMEVAEISFYADDISDLAGFPDLTPGGTTGDGAADDFEERDVIFARISNLVTVRSDVFTAYILVRVGADGPQKRVMAILDRSDVYPGGTGKVKIRAVHPVPDPR